MTEPLWTPSAERIEASVLQRYRQALAEQGAGSFADYASLHRWSVTEPGAFWRRIRTYGGVLSRIHI